MPDHKNSIDRIESSIARVRAVVARLDEAEASLVRGEGVAITQASMTALAADVKRRGRARLIGDTAQHR